MKGTQLHTHTHAHTHTGNAYLHMSPCATAAPPTQLLSRECAGPSNSEQKSEQETEILVRAGERGMGKETGEEGGWAGGWGMWGALISDESNSVNCC